MGLLFSDPGVRGGAPNRLLRLFPSATPFHPPLRYFFPYSRECRGVVKKKSVAEGERRGASLIEPFPPGHRRCSGAGSASRSATTATGPFLVETCTSHSRMTVGTACSSAKCTSRRQGASRGRRRDPCRPSRGPWRRGLSKSVAKAPIAPGRRRRIVDIPRFLSRPIPVRGAFATDLDTPPTRTVTGVPPAPPRASQAAHNGVPPARRPTRAIMRLLASPGTFLVRKAQRELR